MNNDGGGDTWAMAAKNLREFIREKAGKLFVSQIVINWPVLEQYLGRISADYNHRIQVHNWPIIDGKSGRISADYKLMIQLQIGRIGWKIQGKYLLIFSGMNQLVMACHSQHEFIPSLHLLSSRLMRVTNSRSGSPVLAHLLQLIFASFEGVK